MDKSDFRVLLRRQVGYEPMVAVRFEMNEGYGELYAGPSRNVSPAAMGEQTDVAGEELRAGRFVHVLSSGRRRQSYALSRLDDDRILRLPDDRWTELSPITEFGIRYLEFPDLGPNPQVAVVQVAAGDPPTPNSPRPSPISSLPPTSGSPAPSRSAAPAPPRNSGAVAVRVAPTTAVPAARPADVNRSSARPAEARASDGRPPLPAESKGGGTEGARSPDPRQVEAPRVTVAKAIVEAPRVASVEARPRADATASVERGLAQDAIARLSVEELRARLLAEMGKVRATLDRVAEVERLLEASRAREADLLEILGRWRERG